MFRPGLLLSEEFRRFLGGRDSAYEGRGLWYFVAVGNVGIFAPGFELCLGCALPGHG